MRRFYFRGEPDGRSQGYPSDSARAAVAVRQAVAGQTSKVEGAVVDVCARNARKRAFEHRTGGLPGSQARNSRPRWLCGAKFRPAVERSETSRCRRLTDKKSASERYGTPPTVGAVPKRCGGNNPEVLEPAEPNQCNERGHPGKLIQIDVGKFSKFRSIRYRIPGGRTGLNSMCGIRRGFVHAKTR